MATKNPVPAVTPVAPPVAPQTAPVPKGPPPLMPVAQAPIVASGAPNPPPPPLAPTVEAMAAQTNSQATALPQQQAHPYNSQAPAGPLQKVASPVPVVSPVQQVFPVTSGVTPSNGEPPPLGQEKPKTFDFSHTPDAAGEEAAMKAEQNSPAFKLGESVPEGAGGGWLRRESDGSGYIANPDGSIYKVDAKGQTTQIQQPASGGQDSYDRMREEGHIADKLRNEQTLAKNAQYRRDTDYESAMRDAIQQRDPEARAAMQKASSEKYQAGQSQASKETDANRASSEAAKTAEVSHQNALSEEKAKHESKTAENAQKAQADEKVAQQTAASAQQLELLKGSLPQIRAIRHLNPDMSESVDYYDSHDPSLVGGPPPLMGAGRPGAAVPMTAQAGQEAKAPAFSDNPPEIQSQAVAVAKEHGVDAVNSWLVAHGHAPMPLAEK